MYKLLFLLIFFINSIHCYQVSKTFLVSDSWFTNQDFTLQDVIIACQKFPKNKLTIKEIKDIYWCSKKFVLNYELTLTIIQKETGLIIKPTTNINRYNELLIRALSVASDINGKDLKVFNSFQAQVYHGCKTLRYWFNVFYKGKEIQLFCSGEIIKPQNASSYSLYKYTPYYSLTLHNGKRIAGNKIIKRLIADVMKTGGDS